MVKFGLKSKGVGVASLRGVFGIQYRIVLFYQIVVYGIQLCTGRDTDSSLDEDPYAWIPR